MFDQLAATAFSNAIQPVLEMFQKASVEALVPFGMSMKQVSFGASFATHREIGGLPAHVRIACAPFGTPGFLTRTTLCLAQRHMQNGFTWDLIVPFDVDVAFESCHEMFVKRLGAPRVKLAHGEMHVMHQYDAVKYATYSGVILTSEYPHGPPAARLEIKADGLTKLELTEEEVARASDEMRGFLRNVASTYLASEGYQDAFKKCQAAAEATFGKNQPSQARPKREVGQA